MNSPCSRRVSKPPKASAGLGALFNGWLTDRLALKNAHWQIGIPVIGHVLGSCALITYLLWPRDLLLLAGESLRYALVLVSCTIVVPVILLWRTYQHLTGLARVSAYVSSAPGS